MTHKTATVVCCIEAGFLETQTLRLCESLRRWGGCIHHAEILAIQTRWGPSLQPSTLHQLQNLDVRVVYDDSIKDFSWFPYMNKPKALLIAESMASSHNIIWLDSDILIAKSPDLLLLSSDEDFVACAPDKNIGSTGKDDPCDVYWQAIYDSFSLPIESIPWITTESCHRNIRCYWNSGVFAFRKGIKFAEAYWETCRKILRNRIGKKGSRFHFSDQVALGLTMLLTQLRWRPLPYAYNTTLGLNFNYPEMNPHVIRQANLIHYHDAMNPASWNKFLEHIQHLPHVYEWLEPQGPIINTSPLWKRLLAIGPWYIRHLKKWYYEKHPANQFL